MWEDEVLEELHRIREEHAKSFNYDFDAICADWLRKQAESGRTLVSLQPKKQPSEPPQPVIQQNPT